MANLNRVKNVKMRADQLLIHPFAQRVLSPAHVKKLRDTLDLDALSFVHAVEYAPAGHKHGVYVVDGQHRIRAVVEEGCGEWEMNVQIHIDVKNDARASELFLRLNTRLVVGPYDKFTNELKANDDTAIGISDIAKKYHLNVAKASGDGCLACISALKKSYKLDDGKALDRALALLTQAYGTKAAALEGKLIEGTAILASKHNGDLEDAALVKKLAKYPGGASAFIGDAKGRLQFNRGSLSRSVAALLVETYNLGRRAGKLDPI